METAGAVILAAGGSSRLGEPKQFLIYRGMSLIRRAVEAALGGGCSPVIVVAGRDRLRIAGELAALPVRVIDNPDWERGIGTSIRAGVGAILESEPDCPAVVLMACDQPFVDADRIASLIIQRAQGPGKIVASRYEGIAGVPALFDRVYMDRLQRLPDHQGARYLLASDPSAVIGVSFPEGATDVDTAEDYQRLLGMSPNAKQQLDDVKHSPLRDWT